MKAAYLHIPFCDHICYYCDFNKYLIKNQPVDDYLKAMDKEIRTMMTSHNRLDLQTLFVGGGTPTALTPDQLSFFLKIVKQALWHEGIQEYTFEANPENMTEEKLSRMYEEGVNRLSIGVQTFNSTGLKEIGRLHSVEEVYRGLELARHIGFENVSIDLMFGLPGQTESDLDRSIDEALKLQPDHLSIYALQVEPKTIFYNRMRKGELHLPGPDREADMYDQLIERLEEKGYLQYEISNFAKPGYESKHNLLYWQNEMYFGFGAGAHGYVDDERVVNAGAVKGYIRRVEETGSAVISTHPVPLVEQIEEELFLGLRTRFGVSKERFKEKFHREIETVYGEVISRLKEKQLLIEEGDRLILSQEGLFISNEVLSYFLQPTIIDKSKED
ncbi:radical SAM family heme chaperone HemW [Pullulanibacillus sp. KACC 23026]|uniref:radical SAM family heme chaperone HemW n=1 Tax=Pullulanibacillus sp. KACC 23026 TaxID=3028315 RepID=UPI0023B0BF2D|nr:radical SAM family heme chaperone HemW [Pullulanibacillus sp. KACC 23026]WEG14919.1 radical SAM family heme chaperone HemW [Pullulanibacillus sp. KACC 23026]